MAIIGTTSPAMLRYSIDSSTGRHAMSNKQERIFNTITNITKVTSSYHHIIGNIFIRLQAEKEMQAFM
jgi:hypothetical protein